jgi:hypothetical protein
MVCAVPVPSEVHAVHLVSPGELNENVPFLIRRYPAGSEEALGKVA